MLALAKLPALAGHAVYSTNHMQASTRITQEAEVAHVKLKARSCSELMEGARLTVS